MNILSANRWLFNWLIFLFSPSKHHYINFIVAHYQFFRSKNDTLQRQYVQLLQSDIDRGLKKYHGKFSLKVDTLRSFKALLNDEDGQQLFFRLLTNRENSLQLNIKYFLQQATVIVSDICGPNGEQNISLTSNNLDGRTICIAVYLYFELEERLDDYERQCRLSIASSAMENLPAFNF